MGGSISLIPFSSSKGTARDFCFAATACVCVPRLGRLGKPFIHFFLVGEKFLDARALLHTLEMRGDVGEAREVTSC